MASRQVRVVVGSLRGFTENLCKRLALNVNAELLRVTPVDTGWARANWVPNIGSPFEGTAGTREEAEAGLVNHAPRESGLASVVTTYKLPSQIHQTNNVPYIQLLNQGTSSQAPAMFVQAAILRAVGRTR